MKKNSGWRQAVISIANVLTLVVLVGCASTRSQPSDRLAANVAQTDAAYRTLGRGPNIDYDHGLAAITMQINGETPSQARSELASVGVKLDPPASKLPLAHYYVAPPRRSPNESEKVGVPMLLQYDTTKAPLYPSDGLVVSATAVYRRINGEPHLTLVSGEDRMTLNGAIHPLNVDNVAPITAMARRGRHVATSGFRNMVSPGTMTERTGIFLTEPYDPNKAIVLMVPGLQSTPFAFADLLKQMRNDPEVSAHFQVWTFMYATGTPVFFNALELREELEKTVRLVDPRDHDFATRHIVALGHSMGGLMAHTLVSSSGDTIWQSVFTVRPEQLNGDRQTIAEIRNALVFRRNPRVVRAIFAATPHRGSNMADSWIGHIGESFIHLPQSLQTGFVELVEDNPRAATSEAAKFRKDFNFTSVRALSPREPALRALAELPIAVPFHTIVGQHNAGPIETSSDGVVPYSSSHLNGAASERAVPSGHGVCQNLEAQREVIRILHLEISRGALVRRKPACPPAMASNETKSFTTTQPSRRLLP